MKTEDAARDDEVREWLDQNGFGDVAVGPDISTDIEGCVVGVPTASVRELLRALCVRKPTPWSAVAIMPGDEPERIVLHVRAPEFTP